MLWYSALNGARLRAGYQQGATVVDLHRCDVGIIKKKHEGRESLTLTYSKAIWVIFRHDGITIVVFVYPPVLCCRLGSRRRCLSARLVLMVGKRALLSIRLSLVVGWEAGVVVYPPILCCRLGSGRRCLSARLVL